MALSEEQIRLLERYSCEFRTLYVDVSAPGELLNQDTLLLEHRQRGRKNLRAGGRRRGLLGGLR